MKEGAAKNGSNKARRSVRWCNPGIYMINTTNKDRNKEESCQSCILPSKQKH